MMGPAFNSRNKRVFDAVFGGVDVSQPTPAATPATGFTAPGQIFGGPLSFNHDRQQAPISDTRRPQQSNGSEHVRDQIHWDQSWHIVTHALNVPDSLAQSSEDIKPDKESLDAGFYEALEDLLDPHTRVPLASHTESVIVWHTQQVRQHFLSQILPAILHLRCQKESESLVISSVKILDAAHRQYLHCLSIILEHINLSLPKVSQLILQKFRRDLHAIVSNSISEPLSNALAKVLRRQVSTILGLRWRNEHENTPIRDTHTFPSRSSTKFETISNGERPVISAEGPLTETARREMLELVRSFQNIGLAGEKFQITFAEIMNDSMTEYVYRGCKGIWSPEELPRYDALEARNSSILPRTAHHSSPSRCLTDLCDWIENRYAKLAVQVFSILDNAKVTWADKEKYKELWTEKEKYKDMSIGHLAELRINELFDIVANWPNGNGALDDLRTAITTPQRRLHLTDVFAKTLNERLLHPGASTIQILQTYISM
jgi:anaphase-promoting complex subunit 2